MKRLTAEFERPAKTDSKSQVSGVTGDLEAGSSDDASSSGTLATRKRYWKLFILRYFQLLFTHLLFLMFVDMCKLYCVFNIVLSIGFLNINLKCINIFFI